MTGRSLAKLLSALRPVSNRAAGGPSDEESPMQTYWFDVFTSTTWEELGIHGFTTCLPMASLCSKLCSISTIKDR